MYRHVDPADINGLANTVPVKIPETITIARTIMIRFIGVDVTFVVASCSSYYKKIHINGKHPKFLTVVHFVGYRFLWLCLFNLFMLTSMPLNNLI